MDYFMFSNLQRWLAGIRFSFNDENNAQTNTDFEVLEKSWNLERLKKIEKLDQLNVWNPEKVYDRKKKIFYVAFKKSWTHPRNSKNYNIFQHNPQKNQYTGINVFPIIIPIFVMIFWKSPLK